MLRTVFGNPWVRALGLLLGLVFTVLLLRLMSSVLIPLMMAFFVAYVFDPVVDRLEARRIPRLAAAVGLLLIIGLLLLSIPLFLLPQVILETEQLIADNSSSRPADGQVEWLDDILADLPMERWLALWDASQADDPEAAREAVRATTFQPREDFPARAELATRIGDWTKRNALQLLQTHSSALASFGKLAGASAAGLFATIGNWILAIVLFVGNFVLFAFVTIYLLKDYDGIVATSLELVPPRFRERTVDIFAKVDGQLKAFMRGQFVVCCCLMTFYAIGLTISGTPLAAPLAIFGGLASFVPYLGLALTIGPAILLTLLKHGVDLHVVGVIATFVVAQAVEGNFLTPKIVGSQVGLGPVWVILAIMVFGSSLGFLGLLLAVPFAAVLKVLVQELLTVYRASAFFSPSASPSSGG